MGDSIFADIPDGDVLTAQINMPSRASNASDSAAVILAPIGAAGSVVAAQIAPIVSQAGSATNFALATIVNLGSIGAGTVVLGSVSLSATATSIAALSASAMAISNPTFASNEQLGVSYASQGSGIALVAHTLQIRYKLT